MESRCRRPFILAAALLCAGLPDILGAQGLAIGPLDVRIEARDDGGYNLYVREKPEIASVLLTESTKDPAMKADNFAYRATEYNEVNGNEKRMLNGRALPSAGKLYSLISSTPLPDAAFGRAFRILIPPVLAYGYSWSRSGAVAVGKGTFINIRSFAKPYADYAGAFQDNPYQIEVSTKPLPPLATEAKPVSATPEPQQSAPPPPADDRTSAKIVAAIQADPGMSLDLVVCLDTTASMVPYIDDIKKNLGPMIRSRVAGFKSCRIGLMLYKDYWPDEYITRKYPFTSDVDAFERNLKSISVYGGGDIPEAVYEALLAAATEFEWQADRRQIILVGDAPPHPEPRGKIGFADVAREARSRRIELDAIVEPTSVPPPDPGHTEFENEARRIALLAASGVSVRLLALADGPFSQNAAAEARLINERLIGALPPDPRISSLGARTLAADSAGSDADALKTAAESGASYLILARTLASGAGDGGDSAAMAETVSRLIEAATGKELERDVVWRALSLSSSALRTETEFVNGIRVK